MMRLLGDGSAVGASAAANRAYACDTTKNVSSFIEYVGELRPSLDSAGLDVLANITRLKVQRYRNVAGLLIRLQQCHR
jgi:hypothetical protein